MTAEEQKLYDLLYQPAPTPETLPGLLGLRSAQPVKQYSAGGGLPDIAAYLGLHGRLYDGDYQIDLRRPEGLEVPVHLKYTRPLYGGEFKADADLSPTERSLQLHYHRDF